MEQCELEDFLIDKMGMSLTPNQSELCGQYLQNAEKLYVFHNYDVDTIQNIIMGFALWRAISYCEDVTIGVKPGDGADINILQNNIVSVLTKNNIAILSNISQYITIGSKQEYKSILISVIDHAPALHEISSYFIGTDTIWTDRQMRESRLNDLNKGVIFNSMKDYTMNYHAAIIDNITKNVILMTEKYQWAKTLKTS